MAQRLSKGLDDGLFDLFIGVALCLEELAIRIGPLQKVLGAVDFLIVLGPDAVRKVKHRENERTKRGGKPQVVGRDIYADEEMLPKPIARKCGQCTAQNGDGGERKGISPVHVVNRAQAPFVLVVAELEDVIVFHTGRMIPQRFAIEQRSMSTDDRNSCDATLCLNRPTNPRWRVSALGKDMSASVGF